MITTSIQRILAIAFSVLWLVSCAPQPQMDQIPEIDLSAEVEMNGCRLEASLKEGLDGTERGKSESNGKSKSRCEKTFERSEV